MTTPDITPSLTVPTKFCFRCKDDRPIDEFRSCPTSRDGLRGECVPCYKKRTLLARATRKSDEQVFTRHIIQKFWSKVDRTPGQGPKGDCWGWTAGPFDPNIAGIISVAHHNYGAPRVAFFLEYDHWPTPMALHHCDWRKCCRPDHLFEGTQLDNMRDMWAKGRGATSANSRHGSRTEPGKFKGPNNPPKGERNSHAKLTANNVQGIRALCASGLFTQKQIAVWFNVTKELIWKINTRRLWKNL